MDFNNIRLIEKILKVAQYFSRLVNVLLKKKSLRYLYSSLSLSRRTMRAVKHFNVVHTIINFYVRHWKNKSRRGFKLVYYCLLYIFMVCDIIIILYKFKVFRNRQFLLKIFDFVDKVWIVQNTLGILDTLVETVRIKNEKVQVVARMNEVIPRVEADPQEKGKKEESGLAESLSNPFHDIESKLKKGRDSDCKKVLLQLLEQNKKLDSQLIVQSKYIVKLLAEIFLAIGFMYPKQIGEAVLSFSGLISGVSVF